MRYRPALITMVALSMMGGLAHAAVVTTSLQQPFVATVFFSATSEFVDLTGNIHVVSQVTTNPACFPPDPCVHITLHSNLDGVTGIGESTGMLYRVTGEFESDSMNSIPGPAFEIASFSFGVGNTLSNPGHSTGGGQGKVSVTEITVFDALGAMVSVDVAGVCGIIQNCLTAHNAPRIHEPMAMSLPKGREWFSFSPPWVKA